MPPIVVMTGGGIKGAVAAARCPEDNELLLVHIDYGQPSAPEELKALHVLNKTFPSSSVMALTLPHVMQLQEGPGRSGETPAVGADGAVDKNGPSAPVLRGLLPVLMSVGVQCAWRVGASAVVTGVSRLCEATHLGMSGADAPGNGWRELVHSFNLMVDCLSGRGPRVRIETPLMDLGLPQIIKLARRFRIPLERTWTCERAGPRTCGRCSSCTARARAFVEAALVDPLSKSAPAQV
ncbi:MAG: 7-cyano-7-deazaguanine synthase [Phycisphaerales bacterium]|nr:MAG: 7-cyano-7-deazaguanine synthase [Phycisphaerales bacterium]